MIEDCDAHMSLCNDIAKEFAFIKTSLKKVLQLLLLRVIRRKV